MKRNNLSALIPDETMGEEEVGMEDLGGGLDGIDLSQLTDEELMQLYEDGLGGEASVGPEVDQMSAALDGGEEVDPSMLEAAQQQLNLAARRRLAGV